ncbi:MAG: response regulator transcription factor [Treponema sp.]|jgi:two-component system response regulator VanR|nr:response regulator transcription factor [Treponema sp.]
MDIRILVVEDDEHIGNTVAAFLRDAGYEVEICTDGNDALLRVYEGRFKLIILDIMLPGMDGQRVLKEIRKLGDTPVLMMTALSGETPQLRAFDNHADDYITKPFSMLILVKRVEALLRRSGALQSELRYGDLTLLPESYKAHWASVELPLTLREFEILLLLVNNQGKVITHETLLSKVWGYDYDVNEGTVHTHIKNLRAKLPENIIKTIRGVGYTVEKSGGKQ